MKPYNRDLKSMGELLADTNMIRIVTNKGEVFTLDDTPEGLVIRTTARRIVVTPQASNSILINEKE